jgi:ferric-dicitrate binding protein FerR (iron transport regulator)
MGMREPEHDPEYDPELAELVRRATVTLTPVGEPVDAERSLQAFLERHAGIMHASPKTGVRRTSAPARQRPRWAPYAVGFATVLSAIAVFATTRMVRSNRTSFGTTTSYHTGANERATVRVGSAIVTLAPATTITARTSDERGTEVTLDGEALFTVTSTTRVLGTTFTVRRYTTERQTRVVVLDGRVAVNHRGTYASDTVLSARMLAVLPDSGSMVVDRDVPVDDYTAWTNGRLVFRNTPVRSVIAEVGRTYDLDIRLADSTLSDHPLTLTIPVESQSASQVRHVLEAILDAHVTRNGRIITLVPGRASITRPDAMRLSSPEVQYGR